MAFEEFDRAGTNRLPNIGAITEQQKGFQAPDIFKPNMSTDSIIDSDPNSFTNITRNAPPAVASFQPQAQPRPQRAFETLPPALTPEQIGGLPPSDITPSATPFDQQAPPQQGGGFQVDGRAPLTPEQARLQQIRQGIAVGGAVPLPLGGTGSLEGLPPTQQGAQRDMTPEEVARQEEIGQQISGSKEQQQADLMIRKAKQETTIRESGAKSAKEKIARSLREQGITEEAIKDDPRFKEAKTEQEKFKAVSAIQKRETLKRISTERDQKVMSRLTSKEKRNEDGTAKNDAAVAVDFDNFFSDFGPDPSSDKPNSSFLTPSQRKEFQRIMNEASRGRVSDAKFKRIAKFQKDVEKKREREFAKSEAKKADDALTLASKKAQTAEDNAQISAIKANLSEIKSRLEDKNSKTKPSKDERKSLNERRAELMGSLGSFVGGQVKQPTSHEEANEQAKDAGQAEYTFNGASFKVQ